MYNNGQNFSNNQQQYNPNIVPQQQQQQHQPPQQQPFYQGQPGQFAQNSSGYQQQVPPPTQMFDHGGKPNQNQPHPQFIPNGTQFAQPAQVMPQMQSYPQPNNTYPQQQTGIAPYPQPQPIQQQLQQQPQSYGQQPGQSYNNVQQQAAYYSASAVQQQGAYQQGSAVNQAHAMHQQYQVSASTSQNQQYQQQQQQQQTQQMVQQSFQSQQQFVGQQAYQQGQGQQQVQNVQQQQAYNVSQQQFVQQKQHQQHQGQYVQNNSNLPPGSTTVLTSQMYYADSKSSTMMQANRQPSVQQYQPVAYQPQFTATNDINQFSRIPSRQHSFSSINELDPAMQPSQPPVSNAVMLMPRSNSSSSINQTPRPTTPKTNILSHADGSLMLQEVFITAGQLDELTGYAHGLDLQGIWARVKSAGKSGQTELRLALRMNNSNSSSKVSNLEMALSPNSFGLTFDPSVDLLSGVRGELMPGQTHDYNVSLFCSPDNQRVMDPSEDLSAVTVNIKYMMGNVRLYVAHMTFIPLHIFFVDHPQADPTNFVSDPDLLSCSDDGPRLTQSSFLSIWPSPNLTAHQFTFEGVSWKKWYQAYAKAGVLSTITGVTFPTATPSNKEVIKVFERKLSTNRIYVVASREIPNPQSALPNLVFFCSFKVGDLPIGSGGAASRNEGVLILAEFKMSGENWSQCECKMKSVVNSRLWGGLQRAVRAVLLS